MKDDDRSKNNEKLSEKFIWSKDDVKFIPPEENKKRKDEEEKRRK